MLLSNSYALPANYLIFLALKNLILGAESIHQILCSFPARCTWLSTASCLHRLWLYVIGFQIWLDNDILFCLIFSAITMNYVTFKFGCIYKNVSLLRWLCRLHARIPKFSGSCLNIVFFLQILTTLSHQRGLLTSNSRLSPFLSCISCPPCHTFPPQVISVRL